MAKFIEFERDKVLFDWKLFRVSSYELGWRMCGVRGWLDDGR